MTSAPAERFTLRGLSACSAQLLSSYSMFRIDISRMVVVRRLGDPYCRLIQMFAKSVIDVIIDPRRTS